MKSKTYDFLPLKLRRSLKQMGKNLSLARRKRGLTLDMMSERVGASKSTCIRVEKGDPTVAMGIYSMFVFVLGLGSEPFEFVDPSRDERGLVLDEEYIPKRVRHRKKSAWSV